MDRPLVVRLALRSYPSWWRDRYGNDATSTADDLLGEGRSPVVLAGGCFVGALKERIKGPGGSSSPIPAGDRLTLSVIGTHGAWLLALPWAFLLEVMVVEQSAVGVLGPGGRPSPALGRETASLVTGGLTVVLFGASLLITRKRARGTDNGAARLARLPFIAAVVSLMSLVVLVGLPLALDHFDWSTVPNWHPLFLFGWHPEVPASFGVPWGTGVSVTFLVLTWAVIVVGPVVAVGGLTAATRRLPPTGAAPAGQALLGSLAMVALAFNWVALVLWAEASASVGRRSAFRGPNGYTVVPGHEPAVVFVLLGLMVLPLAVGLRSSARSVVARRDLRRS